MSEIQLSVIIPTHNRASELANTVACLKRQTLNVELYEVIVVDDGSTPPVRLGDGEGKPHCSLVRLEGLERSAARNAGAAAAKGRIVVFVDDDMTVGSDFLELHLRAHKEWANTLVVGSVCLSSDFLSTAFGRFRQELEQRDIPQVRGLQTMRNLCTAANMSVPRDVFHRLGGFDGLLRSSEDQDFALRHTAQGGQIAFIPEAKAIHNDNALDIGRYCRRSEWGAEHMIPFCTRYPDWPDNLERERVNGPVMWGREPLLNSFRKVLKLTLIAKPILAMLSFVCSSLGRLAPDSLLTDRLYRLLLGAHIFRGYRKGRKRAAIATGRTAISDGS